MAKGIREKVHYNFSFFSETNNEEVLRGIEW
jgi:hypothetical protein